MQMESHLPERVFVIGDLFPTKALIQVLSLFGIQCLGSDFSSLLDDDLDEYVREAIKGTSVLLAIGGEDLTAHKHISLIHHLRSELGFEGTYIAITTSAELAGQLSRCSLTGDPRWSFEDVWGHKAMTLPILLPGLLSVMARGGLLHSEAWFNLLDQCSIGRIPDMVENAAILVLQDDSEAKDALKNIMTEMKTVDWLPLLLDPHRGMKDVSQFFEQFGNSDLMQDDDQEVLGRVRMFLDATIIGGASNGR